MEAHSVDETYKNAWIGISHLYRTVSPALWTGFNGRKQKLTSLKSLLKTQFNTARVRDLSVYCYYETF
jgi:hypothetical protein